MLLNRPRPRSRPTTIDGELVAFFRVLREQAEHRPALEVAYIREHY